MLFSSCTRKNSRKSVPQGLKAIVICPVDVRAKARTYPTGTFSAPSLVGPLRPTKIWAFSPCAFSFPGGCVSFDGFGLGCRWEGSTHGIETDRLWLCAPHQHSLKDAPDQ